MNELRIRRTACQAYGICAELLPERIRLDDWGYPVIQPGEIPPHLVELALQAVRNCPTAALLMTSGDVPTPGSGTTAA